MLMFWAIGIGLAAFATVILVWPMLNYRDRPSATASIAAMVIGIPAFVLGFYSLIGDYPAAIGEHASSVASNQNSAPPVDEMVTALAERLEQNPGDLDAWLLLGRSYVGLERYVDAREAYRQAYELSEGNDLTAALGYAEAMALADRSTLAGAAGDIIDSTLEKAPQNPKALWYGGLSAVARGDDDTAVERWQLLLNQALPDEVRQIVQQQLASLGVAVGPSTAPATAVVAALAIQISVSVAPALLDAVNPAAALFVVARDPTRPGPPLAVVRQTAGQLPAVIEITDANLMLPGGSLANHPQLKLIARVAVGGNAIAQPGDVFGETIWNAGAAEGNGTSIVIDSVVE